MASKYITYDEYKELGGTVDETTFNRVSFSMEAKMNYITFGRIDKMFDSETVTDDFKSTLKNLEVKLVDFGVSSSTDEVKSGVSSYDNGIESITYNSDEANAEKVETSRVDTICKEYLWKYPELFYRSVNYEF